MNHVVRPADWGDFWAWVHAAKPGERAEYFVGDVALFRYEHKREKEDKKVLRKMRLIEAARKACDDKRVYLVQRKLMTQVFIYLAEKRPAK